MRRRPRSVEGVRKVRYDKPANRKGNVLKLTTVVALSSFLAAPAIAQQRIVKCKEEPPAGAAKIYGNCSLMRADWPRGVRARGGTYCSDRKEHASCWNQLEKKVYKKNESSDGDRDGWACEPRTGPYHRPHLTLGLGSAATQTLSGPRVTAAAIDADGIVRATAMSDEPVLPVATLSYLLNCGRIRCGPMGILGGQLFGQDGLLDVSAVGVGFQLGFVSTESESRDTSFGLGIGYVRDSAVRKLRSDFVVGERAPAGAANVEYVGTHADMFVLVVTYSFGWKPGKTGDR